MEIKVWRDYSKKTNSTAVPSGLPSATYEVTIPSEINPLSPAIIFDGYKKFNYAYIPDFSRYYFVSSLTYGTGHTFAVLELDIGASYAAAIKSYEAYVLRSASRYDGNIVDTKYPMITSSGVLRSRIPTLYDSAKDSYMVQITGADGIKTLFMSQSEFDQFCATLWSGWEQINGTDAVVSAVFDPFQYVNTVRKTPTNLSFWKGSTVEETKLGTVTVGPQNVITGSQGATGNVIKIPKHPGSGARPYLKSGPYSEYTLHLPGAGWVSVPADKIYNDSSMTVELRGEPVEGKGYYNIYAGDRQIMTVTTNVAIPWGIAKSELNIVGNAGAVLSNAAFGAAFGNPIGALAGIAVGMLDMGSTVTKNGAATGMLAVRDDIILQLNYHDTTPEDISRNGRPLMQVVRLGDLTGYTLCGSSHFDGAQTETENNMVNAFLDGGFYNE